MLPINVNLGFLNLPNYEGLYFLIAFLSAIIYLTILSKDNKLDLEIIYEGAFLSIIAGIICGRLFSLIFWDTKAFFSNPLIFFQIWNGGISITGVIGGLIAALIYVKIKKLNFFYHMQFVIPAIILAQIVGRVGCFLNGDGAGVPTNMPWGIVFNPESVAYYKYMPGTPLHPTQLYEIFLNIFLFLFIILTGNNQWITKRRIAWYAMGYGLIRFITEFFRGDSGKWSWLPGISTAQLIAIAGILTGLFILTWSFIYPDKLDADENSIARIKEINPEKNPGKNKKLTE